jgi:hypothetical protein
MRNNKQQTAVEWQHIELLRIIFKYATNKITPRDLQEQTKYILEQAKEMEKERTINFTEDWYFNGTVMMKKIDVKTTIEQHFNETYGGGEK